MTLPCISDSRVDMCTLCKYLKLRKEHHAMSPLFTVKECRECCHGGRPGRGPCHYEIDLAAERAEAKAAAEAEKGQ